jgi:hypothetical protein
MAEYLPGVRCRHHPCLNFRSTRFFRNVHQKLPAAEIDGSRPFAHTENSLFAKACDRLILKVSSLRDWTPVCTAVPCRTLSLTAAGRGDAFDGSTRTSRMTWVTLASFSSSALTLFGSPPAKHKHKRGGRQNGPISDMILDMHDAFGINVHDNPARNQI